MRLLSKIGVISLYLAFVLVFPVFIFGEASGMSWLPVVAMVPLSLLFAVAVAQTCKNCGERLIQKQFGIRLRSFDCCPACIEDPYRIPEQRDIKPAANSSLVIIVRRLAWTIFGAIGAAGCGYAVYLLTTTSLYESLDPQMVSETHTYYLLVGMTVLFLIVFLTGVLATVRARK